MGQTDGRIVVSLDAPYRRAGAQSITHSSAAAEMPDTIRSVLEDSSRPRPIINEAWQAYIIIAGC